jgi:prolipoprotein diacylglyceryltransferase
MAIHSYPAMLYCGLVTGVVAGNLAAHAAGLDAYRVFLATMALIVPALAGARLLYVASHWQFYRRNPRRIWSREGGAAQYGGLALALPLSAPVVAALGLSWSAFWDAAIWTILVGMIFGRIGCVLNGCCAGRRSHWPISAQLPNLKGEWAVRLPTQYMEAVWAAVLLIFALFARPRLHAPGALFWSVAGAYAAGRLVLESTREPRPGARRFTIHHGISVGLILLALGALRFGWPG